MANRLLSGDALKKRAEELNVDMTGEPIYASISGRRKIEEAELQKRVIEAERSLREKNLWRLALISAIASVISTSVALIAIVSK
jgi:hypothetical protein